MAIAGAGGADRVGGAGAEEDFRGEESNTCFVSEHCGRVDVRVFALLPADMSAQGDHRPRRRFKPPSPSNSLLSILASIVATSQPVSSSPLAFLCPSRSTPPLGLPDKYQQGDDGLWRKVDEYSLYGSTVCAVSISPPIPCITECSHPIHSFSQVKIPHLPPWITRFNHHNPLACRKRPIPCLQRPHLTSRTFRRDGHQGLLPNARPSS